MKRFTDLDAFECCRLWWALFDWRRKLTARRPELLGSRHYPAMLERHEETVVPRGKLSLETHQAVIDVIVELWKEGAL